MADVERRPKSPMGPTRQRRPTLLAVFALILLAPRWSHAETGPDTAGFEVGTGLHGSLSFVKASFLLPRFVGNMTLSVGGTAMSATNWAAFTDLDTGETVSVHPVVVGGTFTVGGSSDVKRGFLRTYGGFEGLVGHTMTPYEDAFYGRGNLIGPNVTLGVFGYFGLEVLTSDWMSFIIEGGGGFKTLRLLEEENDFAIAASWLGSGFLLKLGTRFYF